MLKIRPTPTEGEQTGQVRESMTESRKFESNIPAILNTVRDSVQDKIHHIHQGLVSQQERILESQPVHLVIFTCKDTTAPGSVNYQFKMLTSNLQYFTITIIGIDYC